MTSRRVENPVLLALGGEEFVESLSSDAYRILHLPCDTFTKMTRDDFEQRSIRTVLSALFCSQMDCIEIGQHLHICDFQGTYLIRTETLPNPAIIKRELRHLYHGLDFRIVTPEELSVFLASPQSDAHQ